MLEVWIHDDIRRRSGPRQVGLRIAEEQNRAARWRREVCLARVIIFKVCDLARNISEKRINPPIQPLRIAKGRAEQQDNNLEFYDSDGRPRWYDMAVYCQRNAGQLRSQWEKDFIADIAGKVLGRVPSPKQARCILKIFVKLGGDCDPKIQAAYFPK